MLPTQPPLRALVRRDLTPSDLVRLLAELRDEIARVKQARRRHGH